MTRRRSFKTLHSFEGLVGGFPHASLAQGRDGSFYETTIGHFGCCPLRFPGTIFKLDPAGILTTLQRFAKYDCPRAGLTLGADGSFYGTTSGEEESGGRVFKLVPDGALKTLHTFNGTDGGNPFAILTPGPGGSFYGTTSRGGGAIGLGTIFKLDPSGVLTTLHTFEGNDGGSPFASLTLGNDGNFYGTTSGGGALGLGTIFKLDPSGVLTTLHSFEGNDGGSPFASLTLGNDGNFYGTTSGGGALGLGTIFKVDPSGVLTTIHSFNGNDGAGPLASLTLGADGKLYGTTTGGGLGYGVIFRLDLGLGGLRLPGDCNADGRLDISDAVCVLGNLFLGAPESLPCGSGKPDDLTNIRLLDHNGDGKIDLSDPISVLRFLFLGGPAPRLGRECVAIGGCAHACNSP